MVAPWWQAAARYTPACRVMFPAALLTIAVGLSSPHQGFGSHDRRALHHGLALFFGTPCERGYGAAIAARASTSSRAC